jgi:hypothetical protein
VTKVFREALEATVTLKAIAASEEAKTIANITYLYIKRNIIFIIS